MADDIRHDKKVKVRLDTPIVNVGQHEGGFYNIQKNQTEYFGEVEVAPEVAEDLHRRQADWDEHQRNLHRDNGKRDLDAGGFVGNQA